MKKYLKYSWFLIFFCITAAGIKAQTSRFNLESYKSFLQSHKDISSAILMKMHPAGKFVSDIRMNTGAILYLDSISAKYNLTGYETSLIAKNGFMVSQRLNQLPFGGAMLDIFQKDLPLYVSTDALLHSVHISYDRILKDVEVYLLIDKVKELLTILHDGFPGLASKYSNNSEMNIMLHDLDIYLTIPLKLLGENTSPYYSVNSNKIDIVLSKIAGEQGYDEYKLFSDIPVIYDWSQFKPRGHYVDRNHPELEKYFKTMMWLGRIEIYLLPPRSYTTADSVQIHKDIKRQTVDAFLFEELFTETNASAVYADINDLLKFFVGDQDNVTVPDLTYLKNAVSLNNPSELLDDKKLFELQDSLKNQSFAYQLILSQILLHDPMKPDSIVPASSFLLFGQRYIIDSYINSQVVFDKTKSCRLFPSSLDPMFALGNNAAAQLLKNELDNYGYSENLAAVRYLVDSYGDQFWNGTMYNMWLNLIRSLNPPDDRNTLPEFMRTAAFWQEKLNTQLASWSQLRHDNLLYAKQSYTGGTLCSFPYTYIEPFPEFYHNLMLYAGSAATKFSYFSSKYNFMQSIAGYFINLEGTADTLYSISLKELNGTPFSNAEIDFLKRVVYNQSSGSGQMPYDGWYPKLFYEDNIYSSKGFLTQDEIVADIHTIPTDCYGGVAGWVQHVGTGPVDLGVFVAKLPNGQSTAFIGPVLSYYEYTTLNFLRLSDQEWQDSYLLKSLRPSWVNIYLADADGNSLGEGLKLVTSVNDHGLGNEGEIPENYITTSIYPNPVTPFNPTVTISFTVPPKFSGSNIELSIYDIQGQLVRTILNRSMPQGKYVYRWNCKNSNGSFVASGVYISSLKIAGRSFNKKLMLLK